MTRVSGSCRAVPQPEPAAVAPAARRGPPIPIRSALRSACVAVALGLSAAPASAAEDVGVHCFDRSRLVAHLLTAYGETQQSVGYQEGRGVVEFFANTRSGSWTILLTPAADTSCVLESGTREDPAARPETPA